jgi:uncharacterized protein (TIGR03435 family)
VLRGAFILAAAFLGIGALMTIVSLRSHPAPSSRWTAFSIRPATGGSTTVNPGRLESDGMTMRSALSVAYAIPEVRIIGPGWLSWRRFAITAVLDPEAGGFFPALFQKELANYLDLQVHQEKRDFEVYVLRSGNPKLQKAVGHEPFTAVRGWDCAARQVPVDGLAAALQNILGKAVVNETGIPGNYNFEFQWGEDRITSVKEAMRNRFGLELTEGHRTLEALVIDRAEPTVALTIIAKVSRLSTPLPQGLRQRLGRIIAIE